MLATIRPPAPNPNPKMEKMPVAFYFLFALVFLASVGTSNAKTWDCSPLPNPPGYIYGSNYPFQPQEGGPRFTVNKAGLTLSVEFATQAKDLDSVGVSLILENQSGAPLLLHDFKTGFWGFDIHLVDASQKDVEPRPQLKGVREALSNRTFTAGWQSSSLKPGDAIRLNIPLSQAFQLKSPGQYIIKVTWKDSEKIPGGWVPRIEPTIQLEGKILLQKTAQGISISTVK